MTVKVSPKFQVVIPEEVRTALNIKAGARVEVIAKGRVAFIVPVANLEEIKKTLKSKLSSKNIREKKDRKL